MNIELKPCPFCGGEALLSLREDESLWSHDNAVFAQVECGNCDACGGDCCDDPLGEEASHAWNTRPDLSAALAKVEELTKDRDDCLDARHYYAGLYGEALGQRDQLAALLHKARDYVAYAFSEGIDGSFTLGLDIDAALSSITKEPT
jgi:hypothetical protein